MSNNPILDKFRPLFFPETVAVIGASSKGGAMPNVFIRRIRELGFNGDIYPIHPSATEIDGLKAYRTLADTPKKIDYAFVAIAASQIPDILRLANGRVAFAQVISSGFGEVEEGRGLQEQLLVSAQLGGVRLVGPNCLGIFSPDGKLTFVENSPRFSGSVGVISQSGGLGTDIVRRGTARGLRFSSLVTVGNCVDIEPSDLLEYYLEDPCTKVIGLYIESAKDGRRFFEVLRKAKAKKPIVILKGGRTSQGLAAAASHTGSLAGDSRAWTALATQTGCILVDTLEQFIDALLIFQTCNARTSSPTREVALFGNGGGTSVLATDYFAKLGLEVNPFNADLIRELNKLQLPPGTSITNPVDCPVNTLQQEDGKVTGKILNLIYTLGKPDALVMHLNLASFSGRVKPEVLDNLLQAALKIRSQYSKLGVHFILVLRSDGEEELEALRRRFRESVVPLGVPVYDEMSNAAHALIAMNQYESFIVSRGI